MIKWFDKIQNLDNIFVNELIDSKDILFYNNFDDIKIENDNNKKIILISYPFRKSINIS